VNEYLGVFILTIFCSAATVAVIVSLDRLRLFLIRKLGEEE